MKQVRFVFGTLAFLLFVSPSYGENWEYRVEMQEGMGREAQMNSGMESHRSTYEVQQNRRMQLERGTVQSIEEIENLPASAAGRPGDDGMKSRTNMQDQRKGHRGEIDGGY